jgi:hypothetical protein
VPDSSRRSSEKIRFFWPWTLRAAQPSAHPDFQWLNFHNRADRVSGSLKRFAAFSSLRSPEFLSVMTEALFGAPAEPRVGWVVRLKDRVLTWGENLLAPFALISLENGFALFTLFGMTTAMVLRIRSWRQDARKLCERANVRQRRHAPAEAFA